MIDPTKQVQTRSGVPVRILTWRGGTKRYPIVGVIESPDAEEALCSWTDEGAYFAGSLGQREEDLVNVPVQEVTWTRIYGDGTIGSFAFSCRKAALDVGVPIPLIKLIKRVWEDGKVVSVELEEV